MAEEERGQAPDLGSRADDAPPDAPTERPSVTISEAARLCGVSRDAIKRRLIKDPTDFPNAYRADDKSRTWKIPVTDLGAAGLRPAGYRNGPEPEQLQLGDAGVVDELRRQLEALRLEAGRLRVSEAEWRARAEERERALAVVESALRMLPAGDGTAPRRRRWGRRAS